MTRDDLMTLVAKSPLPATMRGLAAMAVATATPAQIDQVSALLAKIAEKPETAREAVIEAGKTWGVPAPILDNIARVIETKQHEGAAKP